MPPAASPPAGLESLQTSIEGLRAVVVALAASRGSPAGGGAKSTSGGGTGDANRDRVEALHTEASLLFLNLRAANRATLESVDRTREAARLAKRELDEQRLKLQNVQYEKGHVRKEIRTSSEFVSEFADEDVGLCDVSTFFAEAEANEKANDDDTLKTDPSASLKALDAHALTLKRLAHELRRREALARRREALEKKKASLTDAAGANRAFLDGLRGELDALRTAFEPLRQKLGTRSDGTAVSLSRRMDARATDDAPREKFSSLPPPLYVLFAALVAVAERGRDDDETETETETENDDTSDKRRRLVVSFETGGEKDEADEADDETDRGRKRARRTDDGAEAEDETERKRTTTDRTEQKRAIVPAPGAHEAHETRVVLTLCATGVAVVFRYFPSLRVVTAEVRGPTSEPASFSRARGRPAGKDVRPTLLVDLFPGDDGTRAPGAAVAGAADARVISHDKSETETRKKAFLSLEWDASRENARTRGRPFLWCQHLAGLDLLPLIPPPPPLAANAAFPAEAEAALAPSTYEQTAVATERAVAAHAEQRRGAAVVAALEARVRDFSSLERGARRVAAAAEARLGAEDLERLADLEDLEGLPTDFAATSRATRAPTPATPGGPVAFLTSFRETFGDDGAEADLEKDGFRWSGSPVARRVAATGDRDAMVRSGARRFAARVEVFESSAKTSSKRAAATDDATSRIARATLEVPAAFPTRPASVALAVRPDAGATVSNRPPPSPAEPLDAELVPENELGARANDARLAEAAANAAEAAEAAAAGGNASRDACAASAGAALVRRVARILRAAETYLPPLGAAEEDGNRRGRERRKA